MPCRRSQFIYPRHSLYMYITESVNQVLSFSPEGQLLLWNRWTVREKIFDEPFERLYRINGCSNDVWNNLVYTSERQSQCEIQNKTIHWQHNVTGKCAYYNIAFSESILRPRSIRIYIYILYMFLLLSNSYVSRKRYTILKAAVSW